MVAALENDVVVLAGVGARQPQAGHHRLGAGIGKAHQFGGRHHLRDALGDRVFALGREREHAADFHALARGCVDARIGVAEDRRAVAQAVVDVFVVVDVGDARAAAVLDVDGAVLAPEAEIRGDAKRQALERPPEVGVAPGQVSGHVPALSCSGKTPGILRAPDTRADSTAYMII